MFAKLLIPLDGSLLAEQAIGGAAELARRCGAAVDLVLVHEPFPHAVSTAPVWAGTDLDGDERYLNGAADRLRRDTTLSVTCAVLRGSAADMICKRAKDVGADLIVMTTHGRTGLSRAWLGSVADAVMRHSLVPVLMLRPKATEQERPARPAAIKHVLVPLDGSAVAADMLSTACEFASANDASLTLLRVVPPVPILMPVDPTMPLAFSPTIPDERATSELVAEVKTQLAETARRLHEASGLAVDAHVRVGERTAEAIVDFAMAHGMDVVAMSTQGRGASRLLLGSVADKVLRSSGLPVLLRRSTRTGRATELAESDVVDQLPALTP